MKTGYEYKGMKQGYAYGYENAMVAGRRAINKSLKALFCARPHVDYSVALTIQRLKNTKTLFF